MPRPSDIRVHECGPYCELCGDCIRCYDEDPCFGNDGGAHVAGPEEDD